MVDRKTQIEPIDGTPKKRMFLSIISDYDLKTGLCELVDNAIDLWMTGGRMTSPEVSIDLDADRQLISVKDNAGGVKRHELSVLIAPGESKNDLTAELIGVFGVGGKRAGIALAEQVTIKTRFQEEESSELNITQEWLQTEDWLLPAFAIPDVEPGTTQVDMSHLRKSLRPEDVDGLRTHLGETYSWFLNQGCIITINGVPVVPIGFETWAFPPEYSPRVIRFDVDMGRDGKLSIELTGGLIQDRDPEKDNYGVYFYCNHRLIVKEERTRDVGYFVSGEAGVPHTDASLCRVIVRMQGPAQLMPWNSSKNGINHSHLAFQQIRPRLIPLVSYFSSLSRRLRDDWDHHVFRHEVGEIQEVHAADITGKRLVLPALPRVNKPRSERYKAASKIQIQNQPWTLGLVESLAMVDVVERQRFETKNRISLILLDSTFEIALKEFIVNRRDLFPPNEYTDAEISRLFSRRHLVTSLILQKRPTLQPLIDSADYYYTLRNKLTHERATVNVVDSDVRNYRLTVEQLLTALFNLEF
jgi:histidine kinase/DNA gyrase B/HSP90-like ATPase